MYLPNPEIIIPIVMSPLLGFLALRINKRLEDFEDIIQNSVERRIWERGSITSREKKVILEKYERDLKNLRREKISNHIYSNIEMKQYNLNCYENILE